MAARLSGVQLTDEEFERIGQAVDLLHRLLIANGNRPPSWVLGLFQITGGDASTRPGQIRQRAGVDARVIADQQLSTDDAQRALIDSRQAAAIVGISPNGIRDLARRGTLPARRAGGRWLFDAAALEFYAEQRAHHLG